MKPYITHDQFPELVHQHELLLNLMDQLQQSAKTETTYESLVSQLRELRQRLIDHFAYEESSGHLLSTLAESPQVQSQATTLLKQHQVLLQDLDALIAMTQATEQKAIPDRDYYNTLTKFVAAFHEHEHQENRLLQDAANQNLGAVD